MLKNIVENYSQCCGSENISVGSGSTDPDSGGQLITDPDANWTFVCLKNMLSSMQYGKSLKNYKILNFFLNFFKSLMKSKDPDPLFQIYGSGSRSLINYL
jgi:hypothetical protein